jgi:hypothetical protein
MSRPNLAQAQSRPVIFIPGIMGTSLCDSRRNIVWGDRFSYTASRLELLKLPVNFDPKAPDLSPCGIIDRVSIIPFLWETNLYSPLKMTLRSFGYKVRRGL